LRLRDQRVWLIGASSGIGAALAPRLVARGAKLAISARRTEQLEEVAARCGGEVIVKPLDVTEAGALDRAAAALKDAWGQIDVLIYNAGTWTPTDIRDFEAGTAIAQIEVNYIGLVRAVATVLPDMIARRGGEIVGVASVSGYAGFPMAAAYSSSKAAANAFLQSIRIDLAKYGVGVTTVNPGFVKTQLTEKNEFGMPFMLSAEEAAEVILRGLLAGHGEIHFPLRLSVPLKLLTALPRPVYERLARRIMLHE
jgi:short-subunit dehydrogenase